MISIFWQLKGSAGSGSDSADLSGLVSLSKNFRSWPRIFKLLRSPGIDFKESIPLTYVAWDGILKL